jgi:hypothetical protein
MHCFCPYLFCCSMHILLHTTSVQPPCYPSLTISLLASDFNLSLTRHIYALWRLCHMKSLWQQFSFVFLKALLPSWQQSSCFSRLSSEIFMVTTLICLLRDCAIYFQTEDILYRDILSLREGVNSRISIIYDVRLYSAA